MKRFISLLLSLFLLSVLVPQVAQAQFGSFGIGDIQNVQVDNLSEQELLNFYRQMQAQGFTIQEVGNIARARGMPASQVSRLTARLNQISTGRDTDSQDRRSLSRTGEDTMLQFDTSLRPLEEELLISELRRLVDERDEEDLIRQLDLILEEGFPVFGAKLFAGSSLSFEPSMNIPTPIDYIFGTDDEVRIDIWGAAEAEYRLIVDPDGNIRIPNIGPVRIGGLKYDDAKERILTNLKRIYSGLNLSEPERGNTFADVSLGNVRSINVSMIGEVRQPGSYTVSSLASVFNMLYAAGGPSRSGTWRGIQIIRGDSVVTEFDLYDLIVHANQRDNIRLKDQDIIRIPPYMNRVRLNGEVKRPGIYEMKDGETLSDLVEFSGGFSEEAYTDRIVLHRKTNIQRSISDVAWPEGGSIEMRNGDEIEIKRILDRYENRVRIEGAVYREGDFELTEGMTLTDLLEKAEGVKPEAYQERGIIFRSQDNLMLESIAFSVRDIVEGNAEDILLKKDDLIRISSLFDLQETFTINVSGAVNNTGRFEYLDGMTLEDAIYLAKGLRDEAAAYRVEVARRVVDEDTRVKVNQIAEVFQFEIDSNFSFRDRDSEFKLQPFDRVFVRTKPNYQRQLTVRIEGEVQFPGEYVLERRDARLTDLIEQAGGLSQYAYPKGASMLRVLEVTSEEVEREDFQHRSNVLAALNLENVNLDRFETINDTTFTPVGIRLDDAIGDPRGLNDLRLQEGDVIRIPRQFQTVRVEGGVLSPVTMRYVPGRGLQSYINSAGGTTDRGQKHRAYIVYANGEVDRVRRFLRIRNNPSVEPGATIIVPEKPASEQMSPQETIALTSAILNTTILLFTVIDRLNRD
ncbi:MAG: SLBB domain-containing protein [Balneolaceae bacterium]|nr:SLBB domain-containing protein [Balneolaceae bacterium]